MGRWGEKESHTVSHNLGINTMPRYEPSLQSHKSTIQKPAVPVTGVLQVFRFFI
jgi:hypothetical protein